MAVLSVLRAAQQGLKSLNIPLLRQGARSIPQTNVALSVPVRRMASNGKVMRILPTNHEVKLFKDHFHFYVLLGAIPLGLVIFYCNVFIGKATLSDIPEDYEPKHWEYYRHPIERFFMKYFHDPMEMSYEKCCHKINIENEKRKHRLLETKVKRLMSKRGDYKGWYYVPVNDRAVWKGKENIQSLRENQAIGPVD